MEAIAVVDRTSYFIGRFVATSITHLSVGYDEALALLETISRKFHSQAKGFELRIKDHPTPKDTAQKVPAFVIIYSLGQI